MTPILVFIIAQVMFGVVALGVTSHPVILQQTKHEVKNVLGIWQLAQDTTSAPEAPPPETQAPAASTPESQPATQAPPETPAPTQPPAAPSTETPAPATTEQPLPTAAPATTETPSAVETPAGNPAPSETSAPSPPVSPSETGTVTPSTEQAGAKTPSPTPTTTETSVSQTEAVLNPEDVITNMEHIDKTSVDEVKKEEDSISQAQTSDEKEKLLVTFAKDKLSDIEKSVKQDDFATTTFAAVRLTDEIDRATQGIQQAPAEQKEKIIQQVSDFCKQADTQLKNQQLSVPEESEQDIEISRSKCFEYQ